MEGCFCADSCPFKFFFDTDLKCQNIVKAGGITNIDPYAKNLITAKIVDPIINITTTTVHQSIEPVEVKEGFYNTRKNISVYNPDENKIITSEADVLTPNIRKIPLPVIRIEREYKEFNAKTGKEIFNNKTLNYFGK